MTVCHFLLFDFGEGAVFRLKLTSVQSRSLNVFENRSYFGEKASGTSAADISSD